MSSQTCAAKATALLNVTTDRQLAQSCAQHDRGLFGSVGSDGVEVLFVIQTSSGRGATLPGNYSELLLAPFTYFEVLSVERQRTWVLAPAEGLMVRLASEDRGACVSTDHLHFYILCQCGIGYST